MKCFNHMHDLIVLNTNGLILKYFSEKFNINPVDEGAWENVVPKKDDEQEKVFIYSIAKEFVDKVLTFQSLLPKTPHPVNPVGREQTESNSPDCSDDEDGREAEDGSDEEDGSEAEDGSDAEAGTDDEDGSDAEAGMDVDEEGAEKEDNDNEIVVVKSRRLTVPVPIFLQGVRRSSQLKAYLLPPTKQLPPPDLPNPLNQKTKLCQLRICREMFLNHFLTTDYQSSKMLSMKDLGTCLSEQQ